MWREYFPGDMGFQWRYPKTLFLSDDAYLTLLCQHVQLSFVKHMGKIKHVVLMLNVSYQLPVFLAWLVHHPDLPSVWFLEQEIYYQLCKLTKMYISFRNPCVYHNLICNHSQCLPCTSTWPFISSCYVAANASCTLCT